MEIDTFQKPEKESIFLRNIFRFFPWHLFKRIPIRYNISTNLTNNARCLYENKGQAPGKAIRYLFPQIQIHRQG